jgi:hypothetical protein
VLLVRLRPASPATGPRSRPTAAQTALTVDPILSRSLLALTVGVALILLSIALNPTRTED